MVAHQLIHRGFQSQIGNPQIGIAVTGLTERTRVVWP
jgi:hypothetical protein